MRWLALAAAGALLVAACGNDDDTAGTPVSVDIVPGDVSLQQVTLADGTVLSYGVAVPEGFDREVEHPVLLAMPPGGQDEVLTMRILEDLWAPEAIARGWVVLSPIAPGGQLFFQGSEELIPEFLDSVGAAFNPEGGRYHLAGISNGGVSAFRVGTLEPDRYASLYTLPGAPRDEDFDRLDRLADIPVALWVGENDSDGWVDGSQRAFDRLSELGATVELNVVAEAGHVIPLTGDEVFEVLESFR